MSGRKTGYSRVPLFLSLIWFGVFVSTLAQSHAFAPSLLELKEIGGDSGRHVVAVRWKQPRARAAGSQLEPVLPQECVEDEPQSILEGTGLVSTWTMECRDGLVGQAVSVLGIAGSGADVLLRIVLEDGQVFNQVLNSDQANFVIPEQPGLLSVTFDYSKIGVEHILSGWDHLLFILGLVLLVGHGRTLLWTITAFTVGHSITLALAVLGIVNFSPQPIEALIAFSIYLLAVELIRSQRNHQTLMEQAPWLVAGGFGLLHGLGFAGALREVGLPEGDIPLALVSFNVGIELGQLLFVALVLLGWWALRVFLFSGLPGPVRFPLT
ncbi:MAG: HupE/UreJ family protein [Myxococcota bacterium]|nr:HupE/UreJ family protein [Myxococcota bacterium]